MSHEKFQSCIDSCANCAVECNHCANACLNEGDVKMLSKCIQLNHECAAMCLFAVDIMSKGGSFATQICELCAEVCEACAKECEKHSHMEHCKKCAEVCNQCAEECRSMSKMAV